MTETSMINLDLLNELGTEIYEMDDFDRAEAVKALDRPQFRNLGYPAQNLLNSLIAILKSGEEEN